MKVTGNLRKLTELGIGFTAVGILALAGCGGGGGGSSGGDTPPPVLTGLVSTFAGTSMTWGFDNGASSVAKFNGPAFITSDGTNLYVTDQVNNNIRKIVIDTGVVSTLAGGTSGASGVADATAGFGADARFNHPNGITIDSTNTSLYVADSGNNNIRKIDIATGAVTTIAGSTTGASGVADATVGTNASFDYPFGISRIGTSLFVTEFNGNTIRKIDLGSNAAVTKLSGRVGYYGYDTGSAASSVFYSPAGLTNDGTSLYVTDSANHDVRKINASTGETTLVAGANFLVTPGYQDSLGSMNSVVRFNGPLGITTDGTYLYVTDTANHTIRKINIASGSVSTLAGTARMSGTTDGTGTAAAFREPRGIFYLNGALYVADWYNGSIRKIK